MKAFFLSREVVLGEVFAKAAGSPLPDTTMKEALSNRAKNNEKVFNRGSVT